MHSFTFTNPKVILIHISQFDTISIIYGSPAHTMITVMFFGDIIIKEHPLVSVFTRRKNINNTRNKQGIHSFCFCFQRLEVGLPGRGMGSWGGGWEEAGDGTVYQDFALFPFSQPCSLDQELQALASLEGLEVLILTCQALGIPRH